MRMDLSMRRFGKKVATPRCVGGGGGVFGLVRLSRHSVQF